METEKDIATYNQIVQENRLFNFLGELDVKYDAIRRDILRLDPLPSVEAGYAAVRKEAARLRILTGSSDEDPLSGGIGTGLLSRRPSDRQQGQNHRGRPDPESRTAKPSADKAKLCCSHCGMAKHTRETCFKLVGFPEWWEDGHKPGKQGKSKAAVAVGSSEVTGCGDSETEGGSRGRSVDDSGFATIGVGAIGGGDSREEGNEPGMKLGFRFPFYTQDQSLHNYDLGPSAPKSCSTSPSVLEDFSPSPSSSSPGHFGPNSSCLYDSDPAGFNVAKKAPGKDKTWIFDCGATDTMTYDLADITGRSTTRKTQIHTANGGVAAVEGAGLAQISPTIKLNCLYVPTLSCKLLSISQVTRELNCRVLMYPKFCLLQDLCTEEIIGRGTEQGGLYVVDEVAQQGVARLAHGTT